MLGGMKSVFGVFHASVNCGALWTAGVVGCIFSSFSRVEVDSERCEVAE